MAEERTRRSTKLPEELPLDLSSAERRLVVTQVVDAIESVHYEMRRLRWIVVGGGVLIFLAFFGSLEVIKDFRGVLVENRAVACRDVIADPETKITASGTCNNPEVRQHYDDRTLCQLRAKLTGSSLTPCAEIAIG